MNSRLAAKIGSQRPRLQHLPAGKRSSAGQDAVDFAESCGLILDDWQAWCLDEMLGEDDVGRWVASVVVLLLPRQNGKNAVLEALELYAFYVLDEPRIIHTAHLAKTAADHMRRMVSLISANPELDAITNVYKSNGKEALERTDNGGRLEFITRGRKTARGGSPTRVVFDEALFLTDEQIQAILPALSAQSMNADPPQMIYTSSAPLPESSVLHRLRNRGLTGEAKSMFFAEWGCELGCDITDRALWYAANPGMGVRISEEWVDENELSTLSAEAFSVERLGVVYPEAGESKNVKLPADAWAAAVSKKPAPAKPGEVTLGFDVSLDGEWSSIAVGCGHLAAPYVEVVEHRQHVGWLPARLVELVAKWKPLAVGVNAAGPAGGQLASVLVAFREAGISAELVKPFNMGEYKQACEGFYTDVVEGRLKRPPNQGPLDLAAADASERTLGDAWAWDLRSATVPISPLVAVTIARALLPTEVPVVEVWAFRE